MRACDEISLSGCLGDGGVLVFAYGKSNGIRLSKLDLLRTVRCDDRADVRVGCAGPRGVEIGSGGVALQGGTELDGAR